MPVSVLASILPAQAANARPVRRFVRCWRGTIALALALGIFCVAGCGSKGSSQLQRAREAAAAEDWKLAIGFLDEAVRVDPNLAEAYVLRGEAHFKTGQAASAGADFEQARKLRPGAFRHSLALAKAYAADEQWDQAIAEATAAMEAQPEDPAAYLVRGQALLANGEHSKALLDFDHAVKIAPDSADAHLERGLAYLERGDYKSAAADFTEAIQLRPRDAYAYWYRSRARAKLQQPAAAESDRLKACELDPTFTYASSSANANASGLTGRESLVAPQNALNPKLK